MGAPRLSTTPTTISDRERVKLRVPLSPVQNVIVSLLAIGYEQPEIARELHITLHSVKGHIKAAALKVPGDLPAVPKLIVWMRGATREVLIGSAFKGLIMDQGREAMRLFRERAKLEESRNREKQLGSSEDATPELATR